jgi:division/cell wall cluster transcriptional repressor MraZ
MPAKNRYTTMLIGEYLHTLDNKKRLSLPAKFRKEVGRKVVLTRGLDQCLFMFPEKTWARIAQKLIDLPIGQADTRGLSRFLLAGAVPGVHTQAFRQNNHAPFDAQSLQPNEYFL